MNDATEIYILKKRIAYLESLLSAHNISFDAPDAPNSQKYNCSDFRGHQPNPCPFLLFLIPRGAVTSTPKRRGG